MFKISLDKMPKQKTHNQTIEVKDFVLKSSEKYSDLEMYNRFDFIIIVGSAACDRLTNFKTIHFIMKLVPLSQYVCFKEI